MRWWHTEAQAEVAELGGYSVLYADPNWKYRVQGGRGAADKHYETMSLAELCLLPVEQLAAPDCALFMWGVWPQMVEAHALMKAWGFTFKTCAFDWVKVYEKAETPVIGLGSWTRANSEFCLLGVRGKPQRVNKGVSQIVMESIEQETIIAPIGEHSEKPAAVRDRIVQLMGDVPRVELFSRHRIPGWDCMGDQVEANVVLTQGAPHVEAHPQAVEQEAHPAARAA